MHQEEVFLTESNDEWLLWAKNKSNSTSRIFRKPSQCFAGNYRHRCKYSTLLPRSSVLSYRHRARAEKFWICRQDGHWRPPSCVWQLTINDEPTATVHPVSNEWRDQHVMESQYLLQIVKCDNRACCSVTRSSYFIIMPRFLPGPLPLTNKAGGGGLRVELNSNEQYPSPKIL